MILSMEPSCTTLWRVWSLNSDDIHGRAQVLKMAKSSPNAARNPPQSCPFELKLSLSSTQQYYNLTKYERKIFIFRGEILIFRFSPQSAFWISRFYQRKIVSPKGIFKKWSSHASENRDLDCSYSIKSLRTSFFVFFGFQRILLRFFRSFEKVFFRKENR